MNKQLKEAIKKYGITYAVDFDGTLAITEYPKIIKPKRSVIKFFIKERQKGHRIILWTCREGQELEDAVNFCKKYGLEFDAINDNDPIRVKRFGSSPRKVGADYYIDDRSVLPFIISFINFFKK